MEKEMNYLILVETEFFALINENGNGNLETAYGNFIKAVISLCYGCADRNTVAVVLAYTEIELQYHHTNRGKPCRPLCAQSPVVYPQDAETSCRKPYPSATTIQSIHHTERNNHRHDTRPAMDRQCHRPR